MRIALAAVFSLIAFAPGSTPANIGAQPAVNDGYGDLVFVPAGPFKMGDNFGDGLPRERPVHVVDLDAFYIGKFETTNAQWKKFREDPGYDDAKFWPEGRVAPKDQVPYWTQANNHGGATPDSDDYPVLGVNWDSATAYTNWLSAKTGKKYRLPTEAEWEYAARAGTHTAYPWGDEWDSSRANGNRNNGRTMPVCQYPPNGFGLCDMIGNVWQWTTDCYHDTYAGAPGDGSAWTSGDCSRRVIRGGSWCNSPAALRVSRRYGDVAAYRNVCVGFRLAQDP